VVADDERLALTNHCCPPQPAAAGLTCNRAVTTSRRRACPLPRIWRYRRAVGPPTRPGTRGAIVRA